MEQHIKKENEKENFDVKKMEAQAIEVETQNCAMKDGGRAPESVTTGDDFKEEDMLKDRCFSDDKSAAEIESIEEEAAESHDQIESLSCQNELNLRQSCALEIEAEKMRKEAIEKEMMPEKRANENQEQMKEKIKKANELEAVVEDCKEKLARSEAALQNKMKLLIATLKGNG